MMRALLSIAILLVALWSGYWFVGKTAVERGFEAFLQEAPARGLDIAQSGYSFAGFPNRFDLTVSEPRLTDQRSEIRWEAPFLQVFSLSYRPWHVIAAFAPEQVIRTPAEDIALQSGKLQASVVVSPSTALTLDRTTFVGDAIRAESSLGWVLEAETLRFATRTDPSRTNAYDIALELLNLSPDPALATRLPDLPPQIALTRVDANASFSAPLDRFAATTRPTLTALSLREAVLTWGGLSIFAKGDLLAVDGTPEGRIEIRVTGWRNLVTLATSMGLIKPEIAPTVLNMMQAVAGSSGDPEVLEMPLIFAGGQMSLGPLPLGPAPRLN
ncbi:DUF2125 domain-containing protein [Pseudotabrizicola alkalilacus]|uniref:DUF2125 domain-containing protein n=1 Tax=Pseudotabrizicola alkalilacus TaxID=2305252 RepID=A0A411Z7W2_9RHOB|nr:DUF2125 domain-containing protein [Pseudotabrizicola alkalilacus]RGP39116.1 DUF2125 domain-containing protein [Pseudotabrizicola alkalilacus]